MYFKIDRDQKLWKDRVQGVTKGTKNLNRQGTECHKNFEWTGWCHKRNQKLWIDRVQSGTKHGDVDIDGFTQNGLNHEIWVLSYPFNHR